MKTKFRGLLVCFIGIIGMMIPGVLRGQIVASRVEGVAPLLVHFEATCSPDQFHHSLFSWNFGDEMSPLWGTDMKNQVFAEGPVTAHLFEQPGFYEVTLVKKNDNGWASFYTIEIYAYDPDIVYGGNLTVCVNPANDTDFTSAPSGSLHISTDSIKNITQYAMPGQRILFKRGGVWSISSTLNWPQNSGSVVIGAYGTGVNPDPMGIYQNNPQIIVNGGNFLPMDFKQNWTIMDITLRDPSQQNGSFGGAESFHHWLFLRVKVDGFDVPIGWSTWNDPQGNTHVDHMGIISCVFENAAINVGYIGSEHLMVMGSIFRNANESH